jgi:hypothetical protein
MSGWLVALTATSPAHLKAVDARVELHELGKRRWVSSYQHRK